MTLKIWKGVSSKDNLQILRKSLRREM